MTISRTELHSELQGLVDSLDDHVTQEDVVRATRALADRVEAEGLEAPEPEEPPFTPDDPRFPDIDIELIGHDASTLSIVNRGTVLLRRAGQPQAVIDEFFLAVTGKKYDEGLHEVTCWFNVAIPEGLDGD